MYIRRNRNLNAQIGPNNTVYKVSHRGCVRAKQSSRHELNMQRNHVTLHFLCRCPDNTALCITSTIPDPGRCLRRLPLQGRRSRRQPLLILFR